MKAGRLLTWRECRQRSGLGCREKLAGLAFMVSVMALGLAALVYAGLR